MEDHIIEALTKQAKELKNIEPTSGKAIIEPKDADEADLSATR